MCPERVELMPGEVATASMRNAWARWVEEFRFTHFVTLTTPYPMSADKFRRFRDCWINRVNRRLYKSRWNKRSVGMHWLSVGEMCAS